MVEGGSVTASVVVVVVVASVVVLVVEITVVGISFSSDDVIWIVDGVVMLFLLGPEGRVFVGLRFTGLLVIVSELKVAGVVLVSPDWFVISVPGSWSGKIRYRLNIRGTAKIIQFK